MKLFFISCLIFFLSAAPNFALAVSGLQNSAKAKTLEKSSDFFSLGNFVKAVPVPSYEMILRSTRIITAIFGILFIHTLLLGAFKFTLASGRDDDVSESRRLVAVGLIGVVSVLLLFFMASAALLKLKHG